MARNALGRGLGALIRELEGKRSEPAPPPPQPQATATNASAVAAMPARQATQGGPQEIDIDLIEPSPYQPRTKFHEQALDELARSIKTSGIIQPLVLRPIGSRFQLIAGERRWRAAQRAGLNKVSAIVRQVPDELALEMTLVENIQREDLNPIEAARAFERLMDEFHLTQDAVAERTGKDRATVANAIRLLKRSEEHTSELQSRLHLVCRLLLEKKKNHARRRRHCRLPQFCYRLLRRPRTSLPLRHRYSHASRPSADSSTRLHYTLTSSSPSSLL